jgi:hypothetical protein
MTKKGVVGTDTLGDDERDTLILNEGISRAKIPSHTKRMKPHEDSATYLP